MFFRNSSLSSPTDTLYHTNLPNVRGEPGHYGSQRVCLRYRPEMLEGVPLAEAVPALIEFFWSTGFNQDIANSAFGRAQARDPRFASLEAWEAASRENPLFPLEVDWEPAGRDLPGLWLECLKLHGETAEPIATAERTGGYPLPAAGGILKPAGGPSNSRFPRRHRMVWRRCAPAPGLSRLPGLSAFRLWPLA